MSDESMNYLEFNNDDQMPSIGLGTWKSGSHEVQSAVYEAIKFGYRHIDCAANYGNEEAVGRGIHQAIEEGIVERDDLWITSKLWNDAHREGQVLTALKQTLTDLDLEYLDLYLIHWPVVMENNADFPLGPGDMIPLEEVPLTETWEQMVYLKERELCLHIGVSNLSEQKLSTLIDASDQTPELNQIELHPYLQQDELLSFCHDHEIHVTAYSPLGSGDRAPVMKKDEEPSLLDNETIKEIAGKHDCQPAQVLIAWSVHRDTAVIPKSTTPEHIKMNLAAIEINLDAEDMNTISKLDRHYRYIDGSFFAVKGSSYSPESIWNEQ